MLVYKADACMFETLPSVLKPISAAGSRVAADVDVAAAFRPVHVSRSWDLVDIAVDKVPGQRSLERPCDEELSQPRCQTHEVAGQSHFHQALEVCRRIR